MNTVSGLDSQIALLRAEIARLQQHRSSMMIMYPVSIGTMILALPISCCVCGAVQSEVIGWLCLIALLLIPIGYTIFVAYQAGSPMAIFSGIGSLALLQDEINKKTRELEALEAQRSQSNQPPGF